MLPTRISAVFRSPPAAPSGLPRSQDGSARIFLASDNLKGMLLMIVARMVFAASDTFTKLASSGLPASEVVVLRNAIALPLVICMAWRGGALKELAAIRDPIVFWRSVLEGVGLLAFVAALPHVTLGQSTVILLTVPILIVALSALVFKEDVGWRRWTAIVVGFAGVILVVGPLNGTANAYLLLTQFTALSWAVRDLVTSRIVGHISSATVSFYATVVGGLVALPGALTGDWHGFGAREAAYLLFGGCFVAGANLLYITALRTGAISVVAPFRYTAAIWASLAGFIVWGDIPDLWGLLGTVCIVASGLYTFYREVETVRTHRQLQR